MQHGPIRAIGKDVSVDLLVVPNASRPGVVGPHGERIKIRVASSPERNKANAAVIELLASVTGARIVTITRGRTSRHKTALLSGVSIGAVTEALNAPS